mgnify:CR=1 FL=1
MLVLDLFCGTKSLQPIITEKGWEYIGLDIEKKFNPDICIDFLQWDYKTIKPDIIWASPDCSVYSMASGSKSFNKNKEPVSDKAKLHLKILDKLKEYKRHDLSYCKYGCDRMKPTTIWTNKPNFIPKKCKNKNPDCNHIRASRGSRTGTQGIPKSERYKVPILLLEELFNS